MAGKDTIAKVGCRIGTSALTWSENIWTPVLVGIGELGLLGLVSSAEMGKASGEEYVFHLATPIDYYDAHVLTFCSYSSRRRIQSSPSMAIVWSRSSLMR